MSEKLFILLMVALSFWAGYDLATARWEDEVARLKQKCDDLARRIPR